MDVVQVVALALLQGLTEFLPVSSSAHLVLLPKLTGWADQGLAFDVAVHAGSLVAVLGYFRRELPPMIRDWSRSLVERRPVGESQLAWAVLWATVPVVLTGLLLQRVIETQLRSTLVIAWATGGFALLLWWADKRRRGNRIEQELGWRDVLVIGVAQAFALIPGTSRSGITMTAGLMMGLSRSAAARFSFLLSIPAIALAGGLQLIHLVRQDAAVDWAALALGFIAASIAAYLCIHVFLRLLERVGMTPFVLYRLVLAVLLIGLTR